jgi:Zn-dependent M28 family amino/carboxypeptidase
MITSSSVIELARVLKDYPNRYSMRFILWAAEEYSNQRSAAFYGSSYHVQQALARGEQIKAGLVMDHIGWPYPGDPTGYSRLGRTMVSLLVLGQIKRFRILMSIPIGIMDRPLSVAVVAGYTTGPTITSAAIRSRTLTLPMSCE